MLVMLSVQEGKKNKKAVRQGKMLMAGERRKGRDGGEGKGSEWSEEMRALLLREGEGIIGRRREKR